MKIYKLAYFITLLSILSAHDLLSQGPPITADNPIMLSGKTINIKTLTEIRHEQMGTFVKVPFMFHYLPTSNSLIAVHVPYVHYDLSNSEGPSGSTLGDINILAKYQFYRNDMTGRTLRMVAKTLQTLPTGKELGADGISTGKYGSYQGIVVGYETIKYGISTELGYNLVSGNNRDELHYKLGFGLPLLRPIYPVKQINVYFEYDNVWHTERDDYELLYATGLQYAVGRFTIEAAVQVPVVKATFSRKNSILFGARYII
jgi:hypothetical protein